MQFNPLTTSSLIIGPLRYFFATYGPQNKLFWDEDPKKRTIDIGYFNDLHKIPLEQRPRILVDRGSYSISKTGISDNLAQGKSFKDTQGTRDMINMLLYTGTAQVLIEARQQGVCELIADMASHFIAWTRPMLCDSQGFKEFGLPMQISECRLLPGSENDQKFQVSLAIPYIKEEQWQVRQDAVSMKGVNVYIQASTPEVNP